MGLVQTIRFSDLKSDELFRLDTKFHILHKKVGWNIFQANSNNLIPLRDILIPTYEIFDYKDDEEYKGIPTGQEYLNEFGDIISYQIITKENHPNRLKYKINSNSILISSLKGARTPALNFDFDLSGYVFSNGFYIFQVSDNWNKKFILHLLRTNRLKNILDNNICRGIGISSYKEEDLLKIQIPNIDLSIQSQAIKQIEPIEKEIQNLKSQKKEDLEIINDVFSEEFDIDLQEVNRLDNIKKFNLKLQNVSFKNNLVRVSFKWQKLEQIQSYIYKNIRNIVKLSNHIIHINNGWSPVSSDIEDGTPVLGQENILKNGKISLQASKYTSLSRNNVANFYISKNDFFVSRGNTVDLVAMAGVVKDDVNKNIIYPDLYIKVEFDNTVDKQYMAYLFNSFIGRVYFKHVSKGKNQTMVKISSKELLDFYLPLAGLKEQARIVKKIKLQLDTQKEIDSKIKKKQAEISLLIEEAIKKGNK